MLQFNNILCSMSKRQVPLFRIGSTCAVRAAQRRCYITQLDMLTNTIIFIIPNYSSAQPPLHKCHQHLKAWLDSSFLHIRIICVIFTYSHISFVLTGANFYFWQICVCKWDLNYVGYITFYFLFRFSAFFIEKSY